MIPSHLTQKLYKITCRCLRCDKVYSKTVARVTDKDPPCPRKACREAAVAEDRARMEANIRQIIEQERAPGITGSNVAKAIDTTATIVQQDYGLTDLKDNVKPGESAVPRLAPRLQNMADGFFAANGRQKKQNTAMGAQMAALGRSAMAGAFRPTETTVVDYALAPERGATLRPQVRIVAG